MPVCVLHTRANSVLTTHRTPVTSLFTVLTGNRNNPLDVVSRLQAGRFRFRLPAGLKGVLFSKKFRPPLGPTQSHI